MSKKKAITRLFNEVKAAIRYRDRLIKMLKECQSEQIKELTKWMIIQQGKFLSALVKRLDKVTGRTVEVIKVDMGWTVEIKVPNEKGELVTFRNNLVYGLEEQDKAVILAKFTKFKRFTAEDVTKSDNWKER
jgi:hypothetical protein